MTEHFSFFDAIQDSNGHYDREYNAQQFTDYFKSLVTTGVMKGAYNQLEVTANGSNMTSSVKSGVAFVEGRYYYNDALLELIHDTEVIGLSRIDRIVVRMDLSTDARYVKTFIKKGVPATSPVVPPLTQTTQVYEISLAQILVVGGQTFIATNAVTDERGTAVICPWAGSKILPNFDNNALAEHIVTKASSTQEGHVKLNNTLNSASTTEAATANAVKQVNDKVDGPWVTIPPNGDFTNMYSSYPLRIKKVGGIVVIDGYLKVASTITNDVIALIPEGYRPRIVMPFKIYKERSPSHEFLNGIVLSSSILIETSERTKYAVGDVLTFNFAYGLE